MSVEAVHIFVRGRVQGVYFRATAQDVAQELGLCGWARNCPDGSVEIRAEGEKERLEKMIAWCHKGPPAARVSAVDVAWVAPERARSFDVRYT